MRTKWLWAVLVAVTLAVAGGLVSGKSLTQGKGDDQRQAGAGYTCPVTGEQLPCPNCCPLNQQR